jgi:hypothetical protein
MDHLRICMNSLRWWALDANRVYLGEKWIEQYCRAEAGDPKVSLGRLLVAINKAAERHPRQDIWITMGEYSQSLLARLDPEEPLPPP